MNVIKAKVVLHWETNGNDEGINTYNLFMPPLLWDKFKQLVQTNSDLMEQEFPNLKTAKATAPLQAKCISDFHDYMRVFENELGKKHSDDTIVERYDVLIECNEMPICDINDCTHVRDFNNEFSFEITKDEE